jgi:hypothetical protein
MSTQLAIVISVGIFAGVLLIALRLKTHVRSVMSVYRLTLELEAINLPGPDSSPRVTLPNNPE